MLSEPPLKFDDNGFLTPYGPILANFATVKRVFVDEFTNSTNRHSIFKRYEELNARLLQLMPGGFTQWVDGSFISRKINPNDIDVLTFVDTILYQRYEQTFRVLRNAFAVGYGRVDANVIQVYPNGHPKLFLYESDYIEWLHSWSRTVQKPRKSKGFIELIIV